MGVACVRLSVCFGWLTPTLIVVGGTRDELTQED